MVETRHMSNLSINFTSKEKQQLAIGLLDCLISITGELEGLKVIMQTEDGREVLKTSCLVVIYATEPALAELGMMLLVNVLSAEHGLETISPKTTLGIDLMTKVGVAAGR